MEAGIGAQHGNRVLHQRTITPPPSSSKDGDEL